MIRDLALLGGGGHSRVVADAAREAGIRLAGILDPRLAADGGGALPVLGGDERLDDSAFVSGHDFHPALTDSAVRGRLLDRLASVGARLRSVVDPRSFVAPSAAIGEGCFVGVGAIVNPETVIGRATIINCGAHVEHDCRIGTLCHIAPGAILAGGVDCGDRVLVGLGARVLPGIRIGDGAVIGAGSTVTNDVPAGETVVGSPARPTR